MTEQQLPDGLPVLAITIQEAAAEAVGQIEAHCRHDPSFNPLSEDVEFLRRMAADPKLAVAAYIAVCTLISGHNGLRRHTLEKIQEAESMKAAHRALLGKIGTA